ncbi:MAG: hypothetical protein M1814_000884 [Vezdaea aestivalis]|nr:MAG: hypothetical protein M1814_000884 [Vezdaea aestivalis]
MKSLKVPETGLDLVGAPDELIGGDAPSASVPQAIQIDLSADLLRELVESRSKTGKIADLFFGKRKSIEYAGKSRDLGCVEETFRSEVYRSARKGNELAFQSLVSHSLTVQGLEKITSKDDAAVQKLKAELREHEEAKRLNKTRIANKSELPPALSGRKGLAARNKTARQLLKAPTRSSYLTPALTRSMPSSPALSATRSPAFHASRPPTSTPTLQSPQSIRLKALRIPILHLLAVHPRTEKWLLRQTRSNPEDCAELVRKFSTTSRDKSGLILSDRWYKELDVWQFPYNEEDRLLVIDNAISAFDRLRLSRFDKQWEMLLRSHMRGKGRGQDLSRLILTAPTGPTAPEIKVTKVKPSPKTEVKSTASTGDLRGRANEKANPAQRSLKRASPPRSQSQPPVKKQRVSEREAESKRLLANAPNKTQRPAPKATRLIAKSSTPLTGKQKTKVKSSEYIVDSSDEEGEDSITVAQKATKGPVSKLPATQALNKEKKPAPKVSAAPAKISLGPVKGTHVARSAKVAGEAPAPFGSLKRKAEVEPQRPTKKPALTPNAGQKPTASPVARKEPIPSIPAPKPVSRPRNNSSPNKPSPLGSSPPTNASDFETDQHYHASSSSSSPLINELKRGITNGTNASKQALKSTAAESALEKKVAAVNGIKASKDSQPANRHRQMPSTSSTSSSSPTQDSTMRLAQKFKANYLKYEKAYKEAQASSHPSQKVIEELHSWSKRLGQMKQQIVQAVSGA